MISKTRAAVLVSAAAGGLVIAAVALAAYSSPKLFVTSSSTSTRIVATANAGDDATGLILIYVPQGTTVSAGQAAGTQIGAVKAQVSALALGGALLPLEGPIVVAPPGAVPAALQTACLGEAVPTATWLLQLSAAGQTINLPAYLRATAGGETALGAAKIQVCLAPPDLPVDRGGATFGAKFLSADLTIDGVFGPVTRGTYLAAWVPWKAGQGVLDVAQFSWTPSAVAPGTVTTTAKTAGKGAVVTGRVTQSGTARAGVRVEILAGAARAALRRVVTVTTKANGTFRVTTRSGTFFRARVTASPAAAPQLCTTLRQTLTNATCINPVVGGFSATSAVVKKR